MYKNNYLNYFIINYSENAYVIGHPSEDIIIPERSILFSVYDNFVLKRAYDFVNVLVKKYNLQRFTEV